MNQADKDMITAISVLWDVPEEHITSKFDTHMAAEARYVYMFYQRLVASNLDQWLKNHRPLFSTK